MFTRFRRWLRQRLAIRTITYLDPRIDAVCRRQLDCISDVEELKFQIDTFFRGVPEQLSDAVLALELQPQEAYDAAKRQRRRLVSQIDVDEQAGLYVPDIHNAAIEGEAI